MITTRNINVNLNKGKLKLRHVTTKDIDVGLRVEPPKEPIKKKSLVTITTTTLPDVADIAEKKRRDDIMAEKKLAMSEPSKEIIELVRSNVKKAVRLEDKKKPWKEMTDEEKKIAIKERTAKMLATKARKKKER